MKKFLAVTLSLTFFHFAAEAADWPTYRADAQRSGYTKETLSPEIALRWSWEGQAPMPAWRTRDTRMPFDHAYQPIVANGALFFGSSADCKIYALDAATGAEKWSVFTDAPIRFAPLYHKERLFVVSDDGHLYCFNAANGNVEWTKFGGPENRMFLGNDRMMSRWPARGGPAVVDGILYYGAGIWPSEGIYLFAMDAETGRLLWRQDSYGAREMDQPHGGARAESGISVQGYLAAAGDRLLIPTGRAVPACLNRDDGAFNYFHLQKYSPGGGSSIVVSGENFLNNGMAYQAGSGERLMNAGTAAVAALPDGTIALARGKSLGVYQWVQKEKLDKKGNPVSYTDIEAVWSIEIDRPARALAVAGDSILAGGDGFVSVVDMTSKAAAWSAEVDGNALGLAVSDGRLFVSTDKGRLYCFGQGSGRSKNYRMDRDAAPYGKNGAYAKAAEEIVRKSGIQDGYCLDLACGDGALAYELAKRTNLQIYAVDADPNNVEKARAKLMAAGLYGVRVTVHQTDPKETAYPDYFADLVVSGRSVTEGASAVPRDELERLQRPYGGIACIGKPGSLDPQIRGPLAGAQSWTHQYSNAANTLCSGDALVDGPLEMLWFRDTDLEMPQRHGRGPGPLFHQGRMFMEGIHAVRAVDAYNGRTLWEYPLPGILKEYDQDHLMGTAGTGSNYCVSDDALYIRREGICLRLDVATGEKLAEFQAPAQRDGAAGTWGYIACAGDTLYGSLSNTGHVVKWRYLKGEMGTQFTESSAFFAMDAVSGELKWIYHADRSIRHNAITVGDGVVFLIDRQIADIDRIDYDLAKRRGGETGDEKPKEHQPGTLLALDADTGQVIWQEKENVYGTMLILSPEYDILLMTYQPTRFRLNSEAGGRMAAFRSTTGERLWDIQADYASRPIVNGRTIYAQPGAWDLLSGAKDETFKFERSYGCGIITSSKEMLFFRSATLGYRNLEGEEKVSNYGGVRVGCWVNAIPAGGLLLIPDAASGCRCSYLIQATMALQARL